MIEYLTKNQFRNLVNQNKGQCHYRGKEKTMFVKNLYNNNLYLLDFRTLFNVVFE